jgi:hypothetical protein
MVVTELAHDRQREAQPPGALLHTVNRPQQPFDTVHPSLLTATVPPCPTSRWARSPGGGYRVRDGHPPKWGGVSGCVR